MAQKVFAFLLALTISSVWLGVSAAQQPMTGHVLRVVTATVLPDKREQLPKIVADITQLLAATKGILWFKVGSDPTTGEYVAVTLWNSQADIDAFLTSDARKSSIEKTRPLTQREPSAKNYHVTEAKK